VGADTKLIIHIVGAALLLGIAVRYADAVKGLMGATTTGFNQVYRAVSLQDAQGQLPVPVVR
jgi:hypothetical protein